MTNRIAIIQPANMTEGLRNFVAMIHNAAAEGNAEEACLLALDLFNDIGEGRPYECRESHEEKKASKVIFPDVETMRCVCD